MTTEIDDAIGKVESLYRALTGKDAPDLPVPYAPIPAEHDPVHHVQEAMDRLTMILAGEPPLDMRQRAQMPGSAWTPPMTIWQSGDELLVNVDLPGVSRDELEVSTQGNVVIVTGRRSPAIGDGHRPRVAEVPYGIFHRIIPLSPVVRAEQLSASLRDGVLTLRIPRERGENAERRMVSVS